MSNSEKDIYWQKVQNKLGDLIKDIEHRKNESIEPEYLNDIRLNEIRKLWAFSDFRIGFNGNTPIYDGGKFRYIYDDLVAGNRDYSNEEHLELDSYLLFEKWLEGKEINILPLNKDDSFSPNILISKEIKNTILEIFQKKEKIIGEDFHKFLPKIGQEELIEIAQLINNEREEEAFQKFFTLNLTFLFKSMPSYGDGHVGLVTKLPIGSKYVSDFALFSIGQGGCKIALIEIEKPTDKLFNNDLSIAKKLNGAFRQITEWSEWITDNKKTFVRSSLDYLIEAPISESYKAKGSFKSLEENQLNQHWEAFGGFTEYCQIFTIIIIGRWSKLNSKERKRLIYLNSRNHDIQIRTYDHVISKSYNDILLYNLEI